MKMQKEDPKGAHVGRRGFLKAMTMAGVAATFPETILAKSKSIGKPENKGNKGKRGNKRKLLLLSGYPQAYESLIQSIKAIREFEFSIVTIKPDYEKPQEIKRTIQAEAPDILFFGMPGTLNPGTVPYGLGYIDVPVILLPSFSDLIMLDADTAAAFRSSGTNAVLARSKEHVIELIKILVAPSILQGKRAVIYSKPFDSSSVPAHNLDAETVFQRTGVRLEFRPLAQLKPLLETVDPASVRKEMERWKSGAVSIKETSDEELFESCKMYVLLRSIVDEEMLSGISMDCLSFSFSKEPLLPVPCLAFTRLRDEGFAFPCEGDICGMLTTMVLQEISQKPSFFCNVSSVDHEKSRTVLRHCVAPLQLLGRDADPLPYRLRDYHGTGRGATPEVSFPVGTEVTFGGFTKNLDKFVMWPGRIREGVYDMDRLSYNQYMPEFKNMRRYCSNRAEVEIKEVDDFYQNIVGVHHVMVAGIYTKELREEMMRLNVDVIGPLDSAAPA
jgi:L-fucose isomerase-like protein